MVSFGLTARGLARARTGALVLLLGALLSACASMAPEGPVATRFDLPVTPHTQSGRAYSQPKPYAGVPSAPSGGHYKVGTPYRQGGVWYVPAEQPDYNEVGLASWYGDAFNGKKTANGEVFDMNVASAAHATLPMPCMVEVTNLENGRTMTVRLNDRGPYHPGRIIDLSHAAATQLGYAIKGTTRVRVRYIGPAPLDGTLIDAPVTLAAGGRLADIMRPPQAMADYQIIPPVAPGAGLRPIGDLAGTYIVQAGAFSSRETAERVAAHLASAGKASVRPLGRGGVTLYRVVVGPLPDSASAGAARSQIAALGFSDARIAQGF